MKPQPGAEVLIEGFRSYEKLVETVGHALRREALAQHLAESDEERDAILHLLARDGPDTPDMAAAGRACEALRGRVEKLCAELRAVGEGDGALTKASDPDELARALGRLDQPGLDRCADVLLLNGHRAFVEPATMPGAELREAVASALAESDAPRERLAVLLGFELKRRGFSLPRDQVAALADPDSDVDSAPACLRHVLRSCAERISTRLVPLSALVGEEDPDDWLERTRQRLLFRSHSSMHKAVAAATSLKYDCVHKALSGRQKAQRIPRELVWCLHGWLHETEAGRQIDAPDEFRGVPVAEAVRLLPELESRFETKEEIYRAVARRTGAKAGSVRRYFQANGQLKYAPLAVYRCANELCRGPRPQKEAKEDAPRERPRSYLADRRTRRAARRLANKARRTLEKLHEAPADPDLECDLKQLRLAMIATMKRQKPVKAAV